MNAQDDQGQLTVYVGAQPVPQDVLALLRELRLSLLEVDTGEAAVALILQTLPRLVLLDARSPSARTRALDACEAVKGDSYSAIVPCVVLCNEQDFCHFFEAGADEVVPASATVTELHVRVRAALRRNERDTDVHPSTRLPGARRIDAELRRRIDGEGRFAACYIDLDHFKEFNDRYGWHNGDRVIRVLARILHDIVKGLCGRDGFVGHIGGDDFLCVVPLADMRRVCDEIVAVFDELIPLQYSEQDRNTGYYFGKDRRGQLHRVPLMTLSIGVATNERRTFAFPAEVSELASEMKNYAKTLVGSMWAVDRRSGEPSRPAPDLAVPDATSVSP